MFARKGILPQLECMTEKVKVNPDENPEIALKAWLTNFWAKPHFCNMHHRTRLRPNLRKAEFWRVSQGHREEHPTPKPVEFEFITGFSCPACYVECALCPPEFHESHFDTFDISTSERASALVKAKEFVSQVNARSCGFALFVGPPGCGKTRLGSNIIRELTDQDALYVRQGQLTYALRANYGCNRRPYDSDEESDGGLPKPLRALQYIRCLLVDEIGCTALANDERLMLDELLKYRYDHRKPTILISNLPLIGTLDKPGLKEFLGDALTDRIKEATGNGKYIVQFSDSSYRRTTGERYLEGIS